MCEQCGCNETSGVRRHSHTHLEINTPILARNDAIAASNRRWLQARGICAINLISSPGTGKTALLEATLDRLAATIPCAVLTGDQYTDRDARRLTGRGAPVHQIETQAACHLNAQQIADHLPRAVPDATRLLFIENVGNLVCPAAFDLGETFKVALLSTTEGEDKPLKYPALFQRASAVVLTKLDLAPYLDWDADLCQQHVRTVQPSAPLFALSARTGDGLPAWIDYLEQCTRRLRG
jgi:hydrogenase nickel incorporation protein HypB